MAEFTVRFTAFDCYKGTFDAESAHEAMKKAYAAWLDQGPEAFSCTQSDTDDWQVHGDGLVPEIEVNHPTDLDDVPDSAPI